MIIGISGKMHSGKDTFAGFLQTELKALGTQFETRAFAAKLKKMGADLTNTPIEWWYSIEGKNKMLDDWNITIGEFQQKLGEEAIRQRIHQDSWVFALFREYYFYSNWIITDVRLLNEANAVKSRGGHVIRIEGDPKNLRSLSSRNQNHKSETDLDNYEFDLVIQNNKSLDDLRLVARETALWLLTSQKSSNIYQ